MKKDIVYIRATFPIEYTSRVVNAINANMPDLVYSQSEVFEQGNRRRRRLRLLELDRLTPVDPILITRFVEVVNEYSYNLAYITEAAAEDITDLDK